MKNIISLLTAFLFIGLTVALADGDRSTSSPVNTASLEGKVFDLKTGETLAGVAVSINGSDQVAYTDFDGNYSFENLKPGTYTLVASFISYKNSLIEDVQIGSENNREIIIQLQAAK